MYISVRFECPQCRDVQLEMNCHRVYLDTVAERPTTSAQEGALTRALALKNADILRLTREVARLKIQLTDSNESEAVDPGSRVSLHKAGGRVYKGIFNDSTCINCESIGHGTQECPNQCIIR